MRVLGVDPGSHRTGWGVVDVEGTRLSHRASGVVSAGGAALPARLALIADGLEAVLSAHRPQVVAVEATFTHKNSKSALLLGHARGVVLLCAARSGATLFEYTPAEIKKAVAGNGRSGKERVARMVRLLLNHPGHPEQDASDALATAICHAVRGGPIAQPVEIP